MITDSTYIPVSSEYDAIDVDNLFLTIHRSNLKSYLERYDCDNENDLEDSLWINYGISIRII